jgi:hypothetical protein
VLEHVEGTTLAHLLRALRSRGEGLSDQAAIYIGVAVLEALAHAHAQVDGGGAPAPIFHLRVAPAAISLGRDGTVKLGEFSAAPGEEPCSPNSLLANPGLATPEEGDKIDVRAAGLLLWELLSGRETTGPIEPLAVVRSDLPRELSAAIGAALDATGAKRTISCAEVASWIKKVARVAGGRDEVRARVGLVVPAPEAEPPAAEVGESARIPLQGWTVRLAPIANKVLSVGAGLPRAGAAVHRLFSVVRPAIATRWPKADALLRSHPRASVGIGVAVAATLMLLVIGRSAAHKTTNSAPTLAASPMPTAAAIDRAPAGTPAPLLAAPSLPSADTAEVVMRSTDPAKNEALAVPPPAERRTAPGALHAEATSPEIPPKIAAVAPRSAPKSASPPPPKGFGYLTVRSSIGYASVYVQLVRYGQVDRRLTVRCGKRFLSLGNPKPTGGEPTWFAPSRTVDIPCGGSLEISMMPKWIP